MCEANTALILEDELHHSLLHIVHLPKLFGGYWLFTLRESITCLSGMEKNFRMQDGETFSLPYDATSIMHYGRYSTQNDKCITNRFSVKVMWYFKVITLVSGIFFPATGLPTIFPKKDVKEMGQRDKLTKTDIERVRRLYSCGIFSTLLTAHKFHLWSPHFEALKLVWPPYFCWNQKWSHVES